MKKEHNIKRSITIYSWNRQVEAGKMTWDDCIKAAVKLGCNGIDSSASSISGIARMFFRRILIPGMR